MLPPGYRRQAFDQLPSTSREALAAARRGEANGLWITAATQSAGRGRRGRAWSTPFGNLAASLLLIDPAPPALAATISFVAAVAACRAAERAAGASALRRLSLKWPNDVLLDGKKLAGILVEGELLADRRRAVVVGIGINCVAHPETGGAIPATDFASAGVAVDAEGLFSLLAEEMASAIASWRRGEGFAAIRAAWLERAAGIGAPIRVNLADRSVEGAFEALDEAGRLILVRPDGHREAFSAGDVFLAAAS
jgi:BirA family transcriptional regulator, biotin operon repressor / biotin---[acetyl-CoA-carboxylase] ligase